MSSILEQQKKKRGRPRAAVLMLPVTVTIPQPIWEYLKETSPERGLAARVRDWIVAGALKDMEKAP